MEVNGENSTIIETPYKCTDKQYKKWDKEDLNNTISKLKLNAVQRTLNPESKMHILLLGNIWGWHNLISKIEPGKYKKKALGYSP